MMGEKRSMVYVYIRESFYLFITDYNGDVIY